MNHKDYLSNADVPEYPTFDSEPEWGPFPKPQWIHKAAWMFMAGIYVFRLLRGRR